MTLKIGLTQNIKKYYNNFIDFSDHYWLNAFNKKKIEFLLIPNNKILSESFLKRINFLILAGGNDVLGNKKETKIRNLVEINLIKKSIKMKIPILGVCRGAQLLNVTFGGKITKVKNHMNTRHKIFFEDNKILKFKNLSVNSFHNYGISKKNLSKSFISFANDENKNIEMFWSKNKKIIGSMWHPEREKNLVFLFRLIEFLSKI